METIGKRIYKLQKGDGVVVVHKWVKKGEPILS